MLPDKSFISSAITWGKKYFLKININFAYLAFTFNVFITNDIPLVMNDIDDDEKKTCLRVAYGK